MRVFVPREPAPEESRVALTPDAVRRIVAAGFSVTVAPSAGERAGFVDAAYIEEGAEIGSSALGAGVVACVGRPTDDEIDGLEAGTVVIGFLQPLADSAYLDRLRGRGLFGFAMESIPRITRAQSMDALSSQATVSGYKAVILAADHSPKLFPMLMTAAGTIAPARVLILGAGVAGLQAIATARRLGAVVSAFDVRPAVKEQVESLGAAFLDLGVKGEETEGGYAKELTAEQQAEQQRALDKRIPDFDIVITTALIPGRPAPRLIPASAVATMRPGSVIVDLAAEAGGNCEATMPGEVIVADRVTVVGLVNLPSLMAADASRLYARNVTALLEHLAPGAELVLDFDDAITAAACVARPQEVSA